MTCLGGGDDDSVYDDSSNVRLPNAVREANGQKLHTYNIYRALKQGRMPSTEQILVYLKDIQTSEALSDEEGLSQDGRVLLRLFRRLVAESSELLRSKNGQDQLQDFIWHSRQADMSGGKRAAASVAGLKNKADAQAAVESGRTVLSMILGNSDFRELIADLAAFAREVVGDTKKTIKEEAHEAHEELLDLDNGRINVAQDEGEPSGSAANGVSGFEEQNTQPSMDPEHANVHFDGKPREGNGQQQQQQQKQYSQRSQHQHTYQNDETAATHTTTYIDAAQREAMLANELNKHPDCPGCQEELQMAKTITKEHGPGQYQPQSQRPSTPPSTASSEASHHVPTIEVTGPSGKDAEPGNGMIMTKTQRKKQKKARQMAAKAQEQNQEIPPHVQQQVENANIHKRTYSEIVQSFPSPYTEQSGSSTKGQAQSHKQASSSDAAAAEDSAHPVAPSPPVPSPHNANAQEEYWDIAKEQDRDQQKQKQKEPELESQQRQQQPAQTLKKKVQSTATGLQSQHFVRQTKSKAKSAINTTRQASSDPVSSNTSPDTNAATRNPNAAADIAATHTSRAVISAKNSVLKRAHGETGKALRVRIQRLISSLGQQSTYASSTGTIAHLLRQYLQTYGRAADEAADAVGRHVEPNDASGQAFKSLWRFMTGFGDRQQWQRAEASFNEAWRLGRDEASLELMAVQISDLVEDMLTKPEFFDNPEARLLELKNETINVAPGFGDALLELLASLGDALASIGEDEELMTVGDTTSQIIDVVFPNGKSYNSALLSDITNSAIPLLLSTVQHVPIPRTEISTPQIDLLLENLILEPGKSIGGSSFFPHDILVDNVLSVSMAKRHRRAYTDTKGQISITARGVCMKADDVGYWMHVHNGFVRFHDRGLASFAVDGRGMDIEMEVELRNSNTDIMVLRSVSVVVHQLTYKLRASKFSCIASLLKPLIKPILKATMERQIEKLVRENMADLNMEVVFARERLRAARAAEARSPGTFVKAVCARRHRDRYDVDVRVGVTQPGQGVFQGRYAPGSLVREWNAERVRQRTDTDQSRIDEWRSDVFNKGREGRVMV
ncbi:putative protein C32A11.02c [Ceratocystis platani]|uniref:HAM1-like N-terminal domain-containing protein n=1 Tax=Ceratocystis fimbriata f. sp. platani TaxID=88771 RepID=A0A0F8CQX6_CERFI|nr:putative protein C32A11.02c [Ceratocystis platani]